MISKPKLILVACGTAIATSTVVAIGIEEAMRERGVRVITQQCKAMEVPGLVALADLVVTTTPVPADLGKPVIQTLAFLTGVGKEEVLDQIEKILRSE